MLLEPLEELQLESFPTESLLTALFSTPLKAECRQVRDVRRSGPKDVRVRSHDPTLRRSRPLSESAAGRRSRRRVTIAELCPAKTLQIRGDGSRTPEHGDLSVRCPRSCLVGDALAVSTVGPPRPQDDVELWIQ